MLKIQCGLLGFTTLQVHTTAIAHIRFVSCSRLARLQPKQFCICKFTKKWFTQGYGETNMLINGTSAARRPKVGGGATAQANYRRWRRGAARSAQGSSYSSVG